MFNIKNLSFSYGAKEVLNNLNFTINKGSFFTIIGPNGSGKTTLLKLLTNHFNKYEGSISLQDKDLRKYTIKEIGQKVAIVPQDMSIKFPFTCLEVVMMGRKPFKSNFSKVKGEDLKIVHKCMELTDTLEFLDKPITELSGGERQRVILAKSLAQTPEIIFLDEAFSNMDICYSIKLLNILKKLVKEENLTVVSIMHDLNMVDTFSDDVLALNKGKIAGLGSVKDVMDPSFIEELFNIKVKKIGEKGLAILPY